MLYLVGNPLPDHAPDPRQQFRRWLHDDAALTRKYECSHTLVNLIDLETPRPCRIPPKQDAE
jgi:hypothetical protein